MGAGHSHTPAEADASRMIPRMVMAASILATFFVIELTTSLLINSLALLADAGHMLTDVVAVFMGLAAVMLAKRGSTSPDRTYGWHRAEVFTAVANAVLLVGVALFILYEAIERLGTGASVPGVPMIVVALAGLVANFAVAMLLVAAGLVVVFGDFRFGPESTYHATFIDASRLKAGQKVRIAPAGVDRPATRSVLGAGHRIVVGANVYDPQSEPARCPPDG